MNSTYDFTLSSASEGVLDGNRLLRSESADVRAIYGQVLRATRGSLSSVATNDVAERFSVAQARLRPNAAQQGVLSILVHWFVYLKKKIEPDRLASFRIDKALDGEICLSRRTELGLTNVIIHDDGTLAFSFIAGRGVAKQDMLEFFDEENVADWEQLTYRFFAL